MASTFGGLNTALSSLYAQRRGLDITGQNIANANTEGYTRQRVKLQAEAGSLNPGVYATTTQVGAGVTVAGVERSRNEYLDERGRAEHANSAYLASQSSAYDQIESVLAEPSDTALQTRLHDMWDSWNDVANNWQDASTRSSMLERSKTVAITLNDTHSALANQYNATFEEMGTYVDQVNTLASAVADMNNQIAVSSAAGLEANELRDKRDLAVGQLAELTGSTAHGKPNGVVNVYLGTAPLVSDFTTRTLALNGSPTIEGNADKKATLYWEDSGSPAQTSGTMGAMLETMNTVLTGVSDSLDGVAAKLASKVNELVVSGYTMTGDPGTPLFDGATAQTLRVIIDDPNAVAFSGGDPSLTTDDRALDNSVADQLAELGASGVGPNQDHQAMIGQLGVAAQSSARRREIQASVTDQADSARQSESGVNLDEEMTHLLTFQRGYEAASRVLTTIDSMLDQLINRTGLVGR
jgi:flagellar hook-associated protein 1